MSGKKCFYSVSHITIRKYDMNSKPMNIKPHIVDKGVNKTIYLFVKVDANTDIKREKDIIKF